jgi:phosphoribosylformylglycinamidine synthase
MTPIIHYYRKTEPSHSLLPSIQEQLKALNLSADASKIQSIETEVCFNIQLSVPALTKDQRDRLEWLLAETFEKHLLQLEKSLLSPSKGRILEFGPRMTFTTPFSSNAVSIAQACNIPLLRCEASTRYQFIVTEDLSAWSLVESWLHDKMTQQVYPEPLQTFATGLTPEPVQIVRILEEGRAALERINRDRGLGFDEVDIDYYCQLFTVRPVNMCMFCLNLPFSHFTMFL